MSEPALNETDKNAAEAQSMPTAADDWPRGGEGRYTAEDLRDALKQLQFYQMPYVARWEAFIRAGLLPRMGRGTSSHDRSKLRPIDDDTIILMILACLYPEASSDIVDRCREIGDMRYGYCSGPLGMQLELPPRIPGVDRMSFFQALKYTFFNPDRVSPVEVAYGEVGPKNPVAWIDTLQYGVSQQPIRQSLVFGAPHHENPIPPIMRFNYFPGQSLILMSAAYKAVVGNVELEEPEAQPLKKPVKSKRKGKAETDAHA
jgi:hypothetical protein